MEIPIKLINAMPIKPVMNMVIPRPFKPSGTLEYFNFSLIAANAIIANAKPVPDPKPKTEASAMV